jgi:hypothetical protein
MPFDRHRLMRSRRLPHGGGRAPLQVQELAKIRTNLSGEWDLSGPRIGSLRRAGVGSGSCRTRRAHAFVRAISLDTRERLRAALAKTKTHPIAEEHAASACARLHVSVPPFIEELDDTL